MGGAAARISGLAKWLARFGYEVSVITGYPNYPTGKIFPEYKKSKKKVEIIDEVKIFRVKVLAVAYGSILIRLLNYFTLLVTSLWIGIRKRNKFDIIIASSPPLTIGIVGRILSFVYKIPWIFDIRDIWPDVAVEAEMINEKSTINEISQKLAQYLYKHAHHITPVTAGKLVKIENKRVDREKLTVVENGIDSDIIKNSITKDWRVDLNLEDKFILTYAGLIGKAQGVNLIVETAKLLKGNNEIHFLIVGEGVEKKNLVEKTNELNLSNVTFIDNQPKEHIPTLLKTSDIGLIPLVNNNLKDAIPSKLLEAWACRLPVILIAGGEAADLVSKTNGGEVLNSYDPVLLKELIFKIKNDIKSLNNYGTNGYNYVMNNLDRKNLAKKMETVINRILRD